MNGQTITSTTINNYIAYLKAEEKAGATIEKYIRDITAFAKFLDEKALTKELAIEYKKTVIG